MAESGTWAFYIAMKLLVIGSGGREHAICHALAASPQCEHLYIAPGNAGTAGLGENISLAVDNHAAVVDFVRRNRVDIVVIGPEAPLADGLADSLRKKNIAVVGPGQAGAVLESSKEWSKRFMLRHGIPTARYRAFESGDLHNAVAYVTTHPLPVVIKASGLAAGKGVFICDNHAEAERVVTDMLTGNSFGASGETIVVEEFLQGIEVSVFVVTDGGSALLLPPAKDYKRIGEGDTGLNTGGMGAVSPVPFADAAFMEQVEQQVVAPTLKGLRAEGIAYQGFIFLGLMNVDGTPYVIEYNVRMGDPETEVVFPRISSDVVEMMAAVTNGGIGDYALKVRSEACCTVMLVSGGYPGAYEKGKPITGLDQVDGSTVFHAGTRQAGDQLLTNGGRVLAVTSFGPDLPTALARSYANADRIDFEGKYFRWDIGQDLMG